MKKHQLRNWLLVGAMGAALFACQSKKNPAPPVPPQGQNLTPCTRDDCLAPPESPSRDKVPCREGECDEQEAGEEAGIHVIEIGEPNEEKSAAVEEIPSNQESVQANTSAETPAEPTLETHSEESSESAERQTEIPSFTEEPTTKFDDFQDSPISENTVVLSLEE